MKKRTIAFVFATIMCLSMVFCVGCNKEKKYVSYYKSAVAIIRNSCKDPDSLKIYSADAYYYTSDGEFNWECKIVWDAKNSFGAYTGKETYYFSYDSSSKKVEYYGDYSISYGLASALGKHVVYK